MLKCILCKGIPGSGKSTWAKSEVSKDPLHWCRINNDQIRDMINDSIYSPDMEKFVTKTRNFMIREALSRNINIIIDNLNISKKHFTEVCLIAQSINKDIEVSEKCFYVNLDEAIRRDSLREGKAKIGPEIIGKWWKESGKESFSNYQPKIEIFTKNNTIKQDVNKEHIYIVDIDGTVADLSHRSSPYATHECLDDKPISNVIETIKSLHNNYKIIFMSGREDKFRDITVQWLNKHVNIDYELFMRPTNDVRPDQIIKKELYEKYIKDNYYVVAWFDDRVRVINMLRNDLGLTVFQLNDIDF